MRILYLMAIDWEWIKQRPQFLALELSKKYNIEVFYLSEVFVKVPLQKENEKTNVCNRVAAIPFRDRNFIGHYIQHKMFDKKIGDYSRYDMVWVSHPALIKYVPKQYEGKVVYDCMDYHAAMCSNRTIKRTFQKTEQKVVQRAELVFASSQKLCCHIENLGGEGKTVLLRNGFESMRLREPKYNKKHVYNLGYIGTVAEWFDMEMLSASLERVKNIEYHIAGPLLNVKLPNRAEIIYEGVIEHKELFSFSENIDCLIMPFVVNDLIEAVDPVKLYEYISMGKCIVAVYYKEIERFAPFVYFYEDKKGYCSLMEELSARGFPPKYNREQQIAFLRANTWKARAEKVFECFDKLLEGE